MESININKFIPEAADAFGQLMTFEAQQEETSPVKPPSEFLQGSKWKVFKEGAIAFFNSIRGHGHIPLAYIICEDEAPNPMMIYDDEHQRLIAVTPLQGIEF
jgi:hypothetical protein